MGSFWVDQELELETTLTRYIRRPSIELESKLDITNNVIKFLNIGLRLIREKFDLKMASYGKFKKLIK